MFPGNGNGEDEVDEDSLKVLPARGLSVEEVGKRFDRNASTVAYWMRKYRIEALSRGRYAAKGGIEQDVLQTLVESGSSRSHRPRRPWG
jgi:transposase